LPITEAELRLIASAAMSGDSSQPVALGLSESSNDR
jgi:hypothetical protein